VTYPGVPPFAQATFRPEDVVRLTPAERWGPALRVVHRNWSKAWEELAGYILPAQGGITSPARRWFDIRYVARPALLDLRKLAR
jgi:hypothetical protein